MNPFKDWDLLKAPAVQNSWLFFMPHFKLTTLAFYKNNKNNENNENNENY